MKKGIWIAVVGLVFSLSGLQAQDYSGAVGLRGGFGGGVTGKFSLGGNAAVEGILVSYSEGLSITGLYEMHKPAVFDVPRLNFYYGGGASLGLGSEGLIGLNGVLGLEYNIKEIPLNISIDWIPGFFVNGDQGFGGEHGGLSLRYYW